MGKKRVYLCGPITGLSYEEATYNWRKNFKELLDSDTIECITPMRGKQYLANQNKLDGGSEMYKDSIMSTAKSIVTRDRFDVMKNCDVIVANLLDAQRVSIGSMVEYGWADAARVPIVTIIEKDKSNIHEHAFIHELSGFVVDNVADAAVIVKAILGADLD